MLGDSWLCTHMFEGNVKLLMGSVSVLGLSLSAGDFIVQTQSLGGAALPPPRPSPLKLLSEPKCQYLSVSFRLVCPGRNFLLLGCQTSCAWSWPPWWGCWLLLVPHHCGVSAEPWTVPVNYKSWASLAHCPQRAVTPEPAARLWKGQPPDCMGAPAPPCTHLQLFPSSATHSIFTASWRLLPWNPPRVLWLHQLHHVPPQLLKASPVSWTLGHSPGFSEGGSDLPQRSWAVGLFEADQPAAYPTFS